MSAGGGLSARDLELAVRLAESLQAEAAAGERAAEGALVRARLAGVPAAVVADDWLPAAVAARRRALRLEVARDALRRVRDEQTGATA